MSTTIPLEQHKMTSTQKDVNSHPLSTVSLGWMSIAEVKSLLGFHCALLDDRLGYWHRPCLLDSYLASMDAVDTSRPGLLLLLDFSSTLTSSVSLTSHTTSTSTSFAHTLPAFLPQPVSFRRSILCQFQTSSYSILFSLPD